MLAVALLALVAVVLLAALLASVFDAEPQWLAELRHALREAAMRCAGWLREFADWVRLGH
jgi:hypothetical protein